MTMQAPRNVDPALYREAMGAIESFAKETYPEKRRREIRESIARWAWYLQENEKHGLAPIDPKLWPIMACMFDNQIEANPVPKSWWEASTNTYVSLPVKFTLPIIRDVFPALIMNKIASVQPMPRSSGGTAQLFWLDFYREDTTDINVTTNDSDWARKGENEVPNTMRMGISSSTVSAVKDILNASWSTEVMEDAGGALGIDVPAEMLTAMSQEILRELEQQVLQEIIDGAAAGNTNWSKTVGASHTNQEWYQTLWHAIITTEQLVRTARHRMCNYLICGLTAFSYLQMSQTYQMQAVPRAAPEGPISSGVVLNAQVGQWMVYSTPYIGTNTIIVSYYPETMLHAGYIWAPYIPLEPMPRIYAEMTKTTGVLVNTDKYTQNVRTRNAKLLVQQNMFGTVTLTA